MNKQPKKLLDQVRDAIRLKHYSIRSEQAYVDWIEYTYSIFCHMLQCLWHRQNHLCTRAASNSVAPAYSNLLQDITVSLRTEDGFCFGMFVEGS